MNISVEVFHWRFLCERQSKLEHGYFRFHDGDPSFLHIEIFTDKTFEELEGVVLWRSTNIGYEQKIATEFFIEISGGLISEVVIEYPYLVILPNTERVRIVQIKRMSRKETA
jgi:hypothetical protein